MSTTLTRPKDANAGLPPAIAATLRALIRRIRLVTLLRGLLTVAAVTLATLLALMGLDAVLPTASLAARIALTLGGLAVVGLSVYLHVIRPLRRRLSLTAVARMVEEHHPEIQERISSTVQLRGSADGDRGSAQLIEALAAEAVIDLRHVVPRKEFNARSLRPFLLAALALSALLGLVFGLWPRHASVAFQRVLAPGINLGNVPAVNLQITPRDVTVAQGDSLTIEAAGNTEQIGRAELEIVDSTGYESRKKGTVTGEAEGRATASWSFPGVMSGFRYRVRAGGALSAYYEVSAVPRPRVEALEVRLEYPPYTKTKPRVVQDPDEPIQALAGTQVTVTATLNKPVQAGELAVGGRSLAGTPASAEGHPTCQWSFTLEAGKDGPCALTLKDAHGFAGEPAGFEARAVKDSPPTVSIITPNEPAITRSSKDTLKVSYSAEDDYGLGAIELLVGFDGAEPSVVPQPSPDPSGPPARTCEGEATLELSQLNLASVSQIKVLVRVSDILPAGLGGPNRALSKPLLITVTHPDEVAARPLPGQASKPGPEAKPEPRDKAPTKPERPEQAKDKDPAKEKDGRFEEELKAIVKQLREAKELSGSLPSALTKTQPGPTVMEQVQAMGRKAGAASRSLQTFIDTWGPTFYGALVLEAQEVSDLDVTVACEDAELIVTFDEAGERPPHARHADMHLDRAIARLEKLQKDAKTRAQDIKQQAAKLEEMKARQQQLAAQAAKQPAQATSQPAQAPAPPWRAEQQKLARELAGALKKDPVALKAQLQASQEQAKALAQEARGMAQEQKAVQQAAQGLADPRTDRSQLQQEVLGQLARQQQALAEQAAKLEQAAQSQDRASAKDLTEAREEMGQAARHLQGAVPEQAAERGQAAAERLDRLAKKAAGDPKLGQAAQDLAQAQKDLNAAVQDVAKGSLENALARLQSGLEEKSRRLKEQAQGVAGQVDALELGPAARQNAESAARDLNEASRSAAEARDRLSRKAPAAEQSQEQATQALSRAADSLDHLGSQLEQMIGPSKSPSPAQSKLGDRAVARALQKATQAARSDNTRQAADASRQAATELAQASQSATEQAQQAGQPTASEATVQNPSPSGTTGKKSEGPVKSQPSATSPAEDLARLRLKGNGKSDWARFGGRMNSQAQDEGARDTPEDYRDLVNRYFKELARQGGEKGK